APMWPDPVPFIKSLSEKSSNDGTGGIAKIGYGTNDSRLGGPFIGDKTPVFKVLASSRHYWQVESKDSYTGKGWIASISGANDLPFQLDFMKINKMDLKLLKGYQPDINRWMFPLPPFPDHVPTTKENAQIFMDMNYPHVIYPSGLKEIIASRGPHFIYDQDLAKIYALDEKQNPVALKNYMIYFDVPKYRVPELTKITDKDSDLIDLTFLSRYTELPINLPARVKKLAEQITASKTNWYDKAKAIESYFNGPDFTYDQKNVAVPGKNDDYVDQFLFKSKRGYCDNFSTSMAVMLRTLGIPTRWVKGYSDGQFLANSKGEPDKQIYQITNNNAHSWVEVYFPGTGWFPFEPTKGFSSDVQFTYDVKNTTTGGSKVTDPVPFKKPQKKLLDPSEENFLKAKKTEKQSLLKSTQKFIKQKWRSFLSVIVIAGLMAAFLYKIRSKWYPYVLILRFRWRNSDEQLGKAYLVLLKQFERYGIKRKNDQTLRNYASYIDFFFSTSEMSRFTARYEQMLYHQTLPPGSWRETRELWENLIKKTIT
ncbi:MAG: DUF4129 domain-containing transglutaminase family protein, partial [Bacillota bacterium]|nr:DUF4129 domain-containing transglutaminase family protein [Bacillota bacterium]